MSAIYYPPERLDPNDKALKVYLGGSISTRESENWQRQLTESLLDKFNHLSILNPRSSNPLSYQEQLVNPHYRAQIEWENDALEAANVVLMVFTDNQPSVSFLMELACYKHKATTTVVFIHEEHAYYQLTRMYCMRNKIVCSSDWDEFIELVKTKIFYKHLSVIPQTSSLQ